MQNILIGSAIADSNDIQYFGHKNNAITRGTSPARLLYCVEKFLDIRIAANHLELDDPEVTISPEDIRLEIRFEVVRLVAISNRMNLNDRNSRRTGSLQPAHGFGDGWSAGCRL